MKLTKSTILIDYFLNSFSRTNREEFQCCICCSYTEVFYIIFKRECFDYSYCKECIEFVVNIRKRCPYTNINVNIDDICMDRRKNKLIEEYKAKNNEIRKYFSKESIKKISVKIDFI